jgi:TadE-like protein
MNRHFPLRQRGQSLTEFVISMVGFGLLLLALLQAILLYRAKTTIDYAALEAARAGALHGVDQGQMKKGLARGLTPLYATATASPSITGTAEAYAKAYTAVLAFGTITVLSPTTASFDDFKEAQYDGTMALPNDTLNFRSTTIGRSGGLSVQDANILKIQVKFTYPLIVPIIDRILGTRDLARTALEGHTVYSLPIVTGAMVRMQSPITNRGNLPAS